MDRLRRLDPGLELVKRFEGLRLTAYQDVGGVWTIGYGCTHDVKPGDVITETQADLRLIEDLGEIEQQLEQYVPWVNDHQFSALVSFCYNVGFGHRGIKDGFLILKNGNASTMLKAILARDFLKAADEFPKWIKVNGVECPGLLRRRLAEQALFLEPEADHGIKSNPAA